jgi:lipopolysaccharide transport system permease protein
MDKIITTYEPDNSLKKGYLPVFGEIFRELRDNRWLTYQLFKRDFFATYKQSLFGIFWALIMPVISVGSFIILKQSGLLSVGEINVPYPIYAVLGLAFWQLFSSGLISSSSSLVRAGSMITQINFSKKSLVFAAAGQSILSFSIQMILVMILFLYYGIAPSIAIALVPLIIIPLLLLTLGLGLIISILNGVVRDVGNVLGLLVTFLMFLTPILYAKPRMGILTNITKYNPLYYLISGSRDLVLTGTISEAKGFLFSAVASLAIFAVCLLVFHLTETRITERV